MPANTIAKTQEQFPDFPGDEEVPTKKKGKKNKKGKGAVQEQPKKDEEDDQSVYKGKPSTFFDLKIADAPLNDPQNPHNFELNQD